MMVRDFAVGGGRGLSERLPCRCPRDEGFVGSGIGGGWRGAYLSWPSCRAVRGGVVWVVDDDGEVGDGAWWWFVKFEDWRVGGLESGLNVCAGAAGVGPGLGRAMWGVRVGEGVDDEDFEVERLEGQDRIVKLWWFIGTISSECICGNYPSSVVVFFC